VADFNVGDVIDGTVTKLVNFGAFVRVRDGLEGLIHISELSNQRVAHPGDVVKEGDTLNLKIISLDSERHRLGLSLKQAEERSVPAPPAPPAPATIGAAAAPARFEERPQRGRGERRDRRDRDYRPEDAISEPDEGIDNTMAAAFAESGLLDQLRGARPKKAKPKVEAAEETDAESAPEAAVAEAAPEPEVAAEPEVAVEPQAAPEAEVVAEAEPEPLVAAAEPAAEVEAPAEPEPEPEPAAAADEPEPEAK
jgi:small subunit ribosomal protein S1